MTHLKLICVAIVLLLISACQTAPAATDITAATSDATSQVVWAEGIERYEISARAGLWSPTANELLAFDCSADQQKVTLVDVPTFAVSELTESLSSEGDIVCPSGIVVRDTPFFWMPDGQSVLIKQLFGELDMDNIFDTAGTFFRVTRDGQIAAEVEIQSVALTSVMDASTQHLLLFGIAGDEMFQLLDRQTFEVLGTFNTLGDYVLTEQSIIGTLEQFPQTALVEIPIDQLSSVKSVEGDLFSADSPVSLLNADAPDRMPDANSKFVGVTPDGRFWLTVEVDGVKSLAYTEADQRENVQLIVPLESGDAVLSPTGRHVAFTTDASIEINEAGVLTGQRTADELLDEAQLYIIEQDTLKVVHQSTANGFLPVLAVDVSWAPTGEHAIIKVGRESEPLVSDNQLFNLQTGEVIASFAADRFKQIPWSPDGTQYAYRSTEDKIWYLGSANDASVQQLTVTGGEHINELVDAIPAWSFDGAWLQLTEFVEGRPAKLHILKVE